MSETKTTKQKQNTDVKPRAKTATKKATTTNTKAQSPKSVKTKVAEPSSTKNTTKKKETVKKETAKKEPSTKKKTADPKKETVKKEVPKKEVPKKAEPKKETPKKTTSKKAEPKKQEEKVLEAPIEEPKKKEEVKKNVPTKVEPKKDPIELKEAPAVKVQNFTISTKTIIGVCCFIIGFAAMFNVAVNKVGTQKRVVTTENMITTAPMPTTTIETTTEETTIVTTQAPEVVYTRKAAPAETVPVNKVVKLSVPFVSQLPTYPTGCEAASATMILKYWGYGTSIDTVVATMPSGLIYQKNGKAYGPSIYEKFVGDPRCTYTSSTPGYGAFAPVVTRTLNNLLNTSKHVARNITGSSLSTLFSYIDKGYPLIVWSTYKMQQPTKANVWYIEGSYEDEPFQYPRGTHVTVLIGYDNYNVYLLDPYSNCTEVYSQSLFSSRYNLLGCQAVAVVPQEPPTTTTTTTTTSSTNKKTTKSTTETTTEESSAVESTTDESTTGESTTEESTSEKDDN